MRYNLRIKILKEYITQLKFSDVSGISPQRISAIISGDRPSMMEKKIIECALGCSKTLFYKKES